MINILRGWAGKYGVQENPDDMKGAKGLVHEFFFPSYRPVMLPSERAFVEGANAAMTILCHQAVPLESCPCTHHASVHLDLRCATCKLLPRTRLRLIADTVPASHLTASYPDSAPSTPLLTV